MKLTELTYRCDSWHICNVYAYDINMGRYIKYCTFSVDDKPPLDGKVFMFNLFGCVMDVFMY